MGCDADKPGEHEDAQHIWQQFAFLAKATQNFMSLIDREYRYQAINDAFLQARDSQRQDIIGRTVADIWGEDAFQFSIKSCLDRCFTGEVVHAEFLTELPGHGPLHMHATYYPYIPADKAGVTHAVIITHDISDRKQVEAELTACERKFGLLADMANDMVFILSQDKITFANRASEQRTGYALTDFFAPGFSFGMLFAPEYTVQASTDIKQLLEGCETPPRETTMICRDGSRLGAIMHGRLIRHQGEAAVLCVLHPHLQE